MLEGEKMVVVRLEPRPQIPDTEPIQILAIKAGLRLGARASILLPEIGLMNLYPD